MAIPGIVRRGARWLRRKLEPRAFILLYHRVGVVASDPWHLAVTPQHFAEHLEILERYARPTPLTGLVRALESGRCPRRTVAVTFDDGYADNLHAAKPLLERHSVPATVFVTTGYIGSEQEFWWDELDRLLLEPATLPEALRLHVDGQSVPWRLGESAHYTEDARRRHRQWEAWSGEHPTQRHALYCVLYSLLQGLSENERRTVLQALGTWAGVQPIVRATHRTLSPIEVRSLLDGGLVEVGAHAVTHAALATLPSVAQREEVRRSKAELERILGHPVRSFAYPYGRRCDYTADTVALLREAGFTSACANFHGAVTPSVDPYQLPRMQVRDWDGDAFTRRLAAWFDGRHLSPAV
jgi:peptidoglycan/xylan/chitin deacetylase (PgdA/CDA1 family)